MLDAPLQHHGSTGLPTPLKSPLLGLTLHHQETFHGFWPHPFHSLVLQGIGFPLADPQIHPVVLLQCLPTNQTPLDTSS
jgi:hypothetical protein